ncbi:uncharacterized protein LOC123257723 [Drosophila ananassae]|uniref:uncharacterized protein LOC123257723 n=1 Tax=Drosophila ananassae TaxID=7217 RepID=UPI001CFFC51E|nr:uncharacterized protein LOC123257723 [Drosophila ananassae]
MLMEELVAKLPISKRVDWARHPATIRPYPTIVDFSSWLTELANVVCMVADIDGKEPRRRLLHASVDREQEEQQESCRRNCPICEGLGQHAVRDCQRFIGATPTERWRLARRHRLCFMCLQSGHMTRSCAASGECPMNGCRRKHHRLLHEANNEGFRRPPQRGGNWRSYNRQAAGPREGVRVNGGAASSVDASATPERNLSCVDEDRERLLFRVLPVTLYGGGKQVDTYALLDEGSSVTMVDNELVAELGVQGVRRQLNVQWFGGTATREPINVVRLQISRAGKSSRHVLRNVYAISNLSLPMQSLHRRDVRSVNKDALLPMKPYVNAVPKLLIGLDHGHLGLPLKTRRFASEGPYAAATELGWVVFGPVEGRRDTPSPRSCLLATSLDDNVERIVEDYFEIENFGVKAAPAATASDDVRAQKILEDTTVRVGRRYQTGLLRKTDNIVLPRSYNMAYNRLVNIEKKIKRDGQFAQEYSRIVNDYIDKGYARRLERQDSGSDRTWEGAVGVCSDIKEMFHQVLFRPEDRCAQRFLWRDGNDQRDPDVYEMCVMTFGAACSPIKAIVDYHYVDDYVGSFATESEAIEVSSRVKKIHAEGGFELCKFSSSSPTVEMLQWMLGPSDHAQSIGWDVQRLVFVDASQSAFASVVYWRITYEDGGVQVRFVCAKTKCAPMRTMTIPRLELQAAVLGTRLMDTIRQDHSVAIAETVLWTDSKTVLRWIGSTHRRNKQFVGNRVAENLESTKMAQWRWLPSADNVADDATRAQRVDLSEEARWLRGPAFLRRPAGSWPGTALTDEADAEGEEEMPSEFVLVGASDPFISLERFSSYRRLLRTTAWVLRFIRRCRGQRDELENYGLNAAECEAAEDFLFRRAQREAFPDEVQAAEKGLDVAKGSDICGLAPYLDGNGILRAYGRIDAALCIPYSARRPVILSHRHGLTEMIVRDAHVRMKHQNVDATMTEIRTRFWITRLRRVLRSVISGCSECIDYFEPLLVTVARHQEKRWVALFTCLTTRAIHLELAHDLSTESCILAIRNFICRRGHVHRLRSDNGKNFVGADREAKRFAEIFEPERIQSELSSKRIEWIFNCSANPSEGGVWERMVQCVKRVLRHTVKEVAPKEHVLESFLIEAENVVNSRPLTHLPVSADQEVPLTPNDLLKGAACPPDTPGLDGGLVKEGATRKHTYPR